MEQYMNSTTQYMMFRMRSKHINSSARTTTKSPPHDGAFSYELIWPPRSYTCSFCRRDFRSAQALGGHMNVHRRDRAKQLKHHHHQSTSNCKAPSQSAAAQVAGENDIHQYRQKQCYNKKSSKFCGGGGGGGGGPGSISTISTSTLVENNGNGIDLELRLGDRPLASAAIM